MAKVRKVAVVLTEKDVTLLTALATGEPYKCLADQMGVAHRTFKWRIERLYGKLGVENRIQAVVLALRKGWIR